MNFDIKNFKSPGASFRGLPFWAWNTDITADKVTHQIGVFAEMGFGGFIVHARKGLRTEYMGDHFMEMVRLSIAEAKRLGLRVWLYDEDGWPSGYAGGAVTIDKKYRQKTLLFTRCKQPSKERAEAIESGEPYLLTSFDIKLRDGYLESYAEGGDVFVYVCAAEDNPRFNGQAYIDTMNPDAVDRFLELTHDKYYEYFAEDFGGTVEAIFTDEPQIARVDPLEISLLDGPYEVFLPWSEDFDESFEAAFGERIVPRLPEVIFELRDKPNTVRYRFNLHISDRFCDAFTKKISAWCRDHRVAFTGHYLYEQSLEVQALSLRDVTRNYAYQDIPGIDVLLGGYEFTTALQCQSVARQCGKTQIMSELYGVTDYTSDFRDYIHQGNWQAALGVSERVPHLTWMSMIGEGKRDYPANFGYQAPWHEKFPLVEDHFARVNAALKCGKAQTRLAVIHPIESFWLLYGPDDLTGAARARRDADFHALCEWLIFGGLDFDYLSEALIPELFDDEKTFGKQSYDAVLVPDLLTLRRSSLRALKKLKENGVRVIFAGGIPSLADGEPCTDIAEFAERCERIGTSKGDILTALSPYRSFESSSDGYIFAERVTDNEKLLFLSPAKEIADRDAAEKKGITLDFDGEFTPTLLDTFSGEAQSLNYSFDGQKTSVFLELYPYDSALLRLAFKKGAPTFENIGTKTAVKVMQTSPVRVTREEENVLLLDMAEYSFDGENYFAREEILRIDGAARREFSLPAIAGKISPQPWSVKDDVKKSVFLRFEFDSEIDTLAYLAFEKVKSLTLNGEPISPETELFYVDRDIKKLPLPRLLRGKNVICAEVEISKTVGLEQMYLLGDFLVFDGALKKDTRDIGFGDVSALGMPFYSGNLAYNLDFESDGGELTLRVPSYRGALVSVYLDEKFIGDIVLPPYRLSLGNVAAGAHTLKLVCYGNRKNTFGSLHWAKFDPYVGAMHWRKTGDAFSYDYKLAPLGIILPATIEKSI